MANVNVTDGRYTVDPLYQWDVNQTLVIYGLSLASIPEIHFCNEGMTAAIVRQSRMDDAGVISVDVPNSLLQKSSAINVYVCIYEGDTFKSLYKIVVPVTARTKPGDYTIEDNDGEIYSFNVLNTLCTNLLAAYDDVDAKHAEAIANLEQSTATYNQTSKLITEYQNLLDAYGADIETYTAAVESYTAAVAEYEQATLNRLSKVTGAVANNFAGLNADGTLKDSGKNANSFVPANNNLIQYANSIFSTLGGTQLNLEGAKIETGSYVGTNYSERTLQLSITPKIFIAATKHGSSASYKMPSLMVLINGGGFALVYDYDGDYFDDYTLTVALFDSIEMGNNFVKWGCNDFSSMNMSGETFVTDGDDSDRYKAALNNSSITYHYIAIG